MNTGLLNGSAATYQDVLDAPEHMIAELLAGKLYVSPRPATPHGAALFRLGYQLFPAFELGLNGPGGWTFATEPEIHLHGDVLVPDLAGWRLSTMHEQRNDIAAVDVRPDWICEVLSPSTEQVDRTVKLHIFKREGVQHVWFVDPRQRTLEVLRRGPNGYASVGSFAEDQRVRAEPFDAIEFALADLWVNVRR